MNTLLRDIQPPDPLAETMDFYDADTELRMFKGKFFSAAESFMHRIDQAVSCDEAIQSIWMESRDSCTGAIAAILAFQTMPRKRVKQILAVIDGKGGHDEVNEFTPAYTTIATLAEYNPQYNSLLKELDEMKMILADAFLPPEPELRDIAPPLPIVNPQFEIIALDEEFIESNQLAAKETSFA